MNGTGTLARRILPRKLRNWLRRPASSVQYLLDRAAFAVGSVSELHITPHWSVRCHPAARTHFEVFRTDPSQADELTAFFRHAHPGMRLLDVGAHYGFFALAALHMGGPDAEVLCVEPSPPAIKVLRANLRANGASGQVRVVNTALGERDGDLRMLTTGPAGADYLVVPAEQRSDAAAVPMRSMHSLLSETAFRPTHLKVDVEGYECEVIESSIEVLSSLKPVIYLELHCKYILERGKRPGTVIANLRRAGYRVFTCEKGAPVDELSLAQCNFNRRLVCTA